MLEKNLAFIANYLWKQSVSNINEILSDSEINNFNMNDYYYLTTIYYLKKPNFGELAEELKLTKPAVSAMVKRLIRNNLVEKLQSEEDRRVYYLKLTDKGERIVEGDNKIFDKLTERIKALSTKEDMAKLEKIVEELAKRIDRT